MIETPVVTAFLDANVLYPALVRDILMRLAQQSLFRARWSVQVQNEWITALVRNRPDIPLARIERPRHLMDSSFPEALVDGYEHRIETLLLPDVNDRHVLAAAIHCEASIIVTANLRDFPIEASSGFGIEAVHPDAFILSLIQSDSSEVVGAIQRLCNSFRNPPKSMDALLAAMAEQGLAASAGALGAAIMRS